LVSKAIKDQRNSRIYGIHKTQTPNISKFCTFTTKVTQIGKYGEMQYDNNINLTNDTYK